MADNAGDGIRRISPYEVCCRLLGLDPGDPENYLRIHTAAVEVFADPTVTTEEQAFTSMLERVRSCSVSADASGE